MGKVVRPRVDYDAAHGDAPRCWVCQQRWPSAFSLVIDMHDRELRIDCAPPVRLRPAQARALAVLVNCMPRWVTRSQLVESAFEDIPDVDAPSPSSVTNAINECKELLKGSRYEIQNEKFGRGWRIVDEETINREIREEEAQMPKSFKALKARDMAVLSRGATKKTKGAPGKPSYKKDRTRDDPNRGKNASGKKQKFSRKNSLKRRRKVEDV